MDIVSWLSKQASKIADNFGNDYGFYVKCTPEDRIDSSTIISLTTYADKGQSALVPCSFKWLRTKNGIAEWREQFKGNSYICDLSDVGSSLQVQITISDSSHPRTAVLNFEGVSIDPVVKQVIRGSLSKGYASFYANLLFSHQPLQCRLEISKDYITFTYEPQKRSCKIAFNMNNPMISCQYQYPTQIKLVFDQESVIQYEMFLSQTHMKQRSNLNYHQFKELILQFNSKKVRDEFLLILKVFNAQRQLKRSPIIQKLEKLDLQDNMDLLLEIQSLRSDLIKMHKAYTKERSEKFAYFSQNIKLQEQISEILNAYSLLFNQTIKKTELDNKSQYKRNDSIVSLLKSYKKLEAQNKILRQMNSRKDSEEDEKQYEFQYQLILHIQKLQAQNLNLKNQVEKLQNGLKSQTASLNHTCSQKALQKYISSPEKQTNLNPQYQSSKNEKIQDQIDYFQRQNKQLKLKLEQALEAYQLEKQEHRKSKAKLQKRINELSEQICMIKRRDSVINRSYSLSMQLQDYNYQQNKILRDQNDFLLSQAEKLSKLCDKYKSQCKKLKEFQKTAKQ